MTVLTLLLSVTMGPGTAHVMAAPPQKDGVVVPMVQSTFVSPDDPKTEVLVHHELDKNPRVKISPVHGWEFPYVTSGFVRRPSFEEFNVRFRVYAQARAENNDVSQMSTRFLLRLWSYNYDRMGFDHPEQFRKIVDVYFAQQGIAGGENTRTLDQQERIEGRGAPPVTVIHIYDTKSVTSPFQLVRELAHEYGHATLSDWGPFKEPESWANGDIGERMYLNWLNDDLRTKRLLPEDALNVDPTRISDYVAKNVHPLVTKIASSGPDTALLKDTSAKGFNELVALAVYAQAVMPPKMMARVLANPVANAGDLNAVIVDIATSREEWAVRIPDYLKGKAIYLPIGNAKVTGGKILGRKGSWVKVQPTGSMVGVSNPQ